jgi:hypothetical protein
LIIIRFFVFVFIYRSIYLLLLAIITLASSVLISIIAKNYIFKCKLNEQRLNIVEFKHTIMWYRSLEQYISKKNHLTRVWQEFSKISFVTTLFLHFDKQNKEIIIYNSNKHFHSSFTKKKKFRFIWPNGFSQSETRVACGGHVC